MGMLEAGSCVHLPVEDDDDDDCFAGNVTPWWVLAAPASESFTCTEHVITTGKWHVSDKTHILMLHNREYCSFTFSFWLHGKTTVSDRHQKYTYLFPFHAKRARVRVRVAVRGRCELCPVTSYLCQSFPIQLVMLSTQILAGMLMRPGHSKTKTKTETKKKLWDRDKYDLFNCTWK